MTRYINHYFWIGRQLERIYHIANLIKVHRAFLVDDRKKDTRHWFSLLISMGEEHFVELHGADAKNNEAVIQDYLIWDLRNPQSLKNLIHLLMNNTQFIQSRFSSISWESINSLHLWFNDNATKLFYTENSEDFLQELIMFVYQIYGVIESNMVRNSNFCYFRLGKMLENAIQAARILDFAFQGKEKINQEKTIALHWLYILKFCSSDELFLSEIEEVPDEQNTGKFLLLCRFSPRSVLYSLHAVLSTLGYLFPARPLKDREKSHELLIQLIAYLEDLMTQNNVKIDYKSESVRVLNKIYDISDKLENEFLNTEVLSPEIKSAELNTTVLCGNQ
jgi:uncharacterized alpha-E superfamily protein